jgi:hypothetical protein
MGDNTNYETAEDDSFEEAIEKDPAATWRNMPKYDPYYTVNHYTAVDGVTGDIRHIIAETQNEAWDKALQHSGWSHGRKALKRELTLSMVQENIDEGEYIELDII